MAKKALGRTVSSIQNVVKSYLEDAATTIQSLNLGSLSLSGDVQMNSNDIQDVNRLNIDDSGGILNGAFGGYRNDQQTDTDIVNLTPAGTQSSIRFRDFENLQDKLEINNGGDVDVLNSDLDLNGNNLLNASNVGSSDFSGNHSDLTNIGSSDHHNKTTSASELTDVSPDSDSNAHHSKTTSASDIFNVSPDSDSNAHHSKTPNEINSNTSVTDTLNMSDFSINDANNIDFGTSGNLPAISQQVGTDDDIQINARNDVLIGSGSFSPNLTVTGNKDFVIDHPTKDGYKLRHSSYEGPVTGGLVYRARVDVINGTGKPNFPDYILQDEFGDDWVTSITPTDHFGSAYLDTDTWTVHADTDGKYDVVVYGQRTSIDALSNRGGITTRKDDESWTDAADRFYDSATNTDIDTVEMVSGVSDIDTMRPQAHETIKQQNSDAQTDTTTDTTSGTTTN